MWQINTYREFFSDLPKYDETKTNIMCEDYDNWLNGKYVGDMKRVKKETELRLDKLCGTHQ